MSKENTVSSVPEAGLPGSDPVAVHRLSDMTGGWFVGDFAPAALSLAAAEVGVKNYVAGETEASHVHRVATEVTLILAGEAVMCGRRVRAGDIVVVPPGVSTGFLAETDVTTVVVKSPSVLGDKYLVEGSAW